jgi:hypothetical protein
MKQLQKTFLSSLWNCDWYFFLQELSLSLSWGRTLASSLRSVNPTKPSWPLPLRRAFKKLQNEVFVAQELSSLTVKAREADLEEAFLQLNWIIALHNRGHPLAEPLAELSRRGLEDFEKEIDAKAEKLEFKMLLPLFLLSFPAFLALLLTPALSLFAATF